MKTSEIDHDINKVQNAVQHQTTFQPVGCQASKPVLRFPDEHWVTVLETSCTFPPAVFSEVMLNLIKNPNITSSYLFRADTFYDSDSDRLHHGNGNGINDRSVASHLKKEYQPRPYSLPGFELLRTVVRQLVPRNPQLDKPLLQTCHFLQRTLGEVEDSAVLYIPHVQDAEQIPFYHPAVSHLAFHHEWKSEKPPADRGLPEKGSISISYRLFPGTPLTNKLERTALRLLQTIHKHGQGQLAGYQKRVHLDQVIGQQRYQNTYARLKAIYGKQLAERWVEVTDPGKHVFEDIGIAAFLIELWRDMYSFRVSEEETDASDLPPFPGFVDIGCGNGVLVYILSAEGYPGWGFDARERKTWSIFPDDVQKKCRRQVLVPDIFMPERDGFEQPENCHNGIFDRNAFIISNHADELTAWTPLLAYLNDSAFIAIPCCSHDLSGSRFRAPLSTKSGKQKDPARLAQQTTPDGERDEGTRLPPNAKCRAAETGSLKRTEAQKKIPSAYATLCSYVKGLAEECGFEVENEVLRIPSTRNQCIIGRRRMPSSSSDNDDAAKKRKIVEIAERELGRSVEDVGAAWIERMESLAKKPGSGH